MTVNEEPEPYVPLTDDEWLDGVIERWEKDGTVPTGEEARAIAQLWLDDMDEPDLDDTNLAEFVNQGTISPELMPWVEGNIATLGDQTLWSDSQRQQAGELSAWLAYLDANR